MRNTYHLRIFLKRMKIRCGPVTRDDLSVFLNTPLVRPPELEQQFSYRPLAKWTVSPVPRLSAAIEQVAHHTLKIIIARLLRLMHSSSSLYDLDTDTDP